MTKTLRARSLARAAWTAGVVGMACGVLACSPVGRVADPAARGVLEGAVDIGPICPVERVDEPCPVPPETYARVTVVVLARDGRPIARRGLDARGEYAVDLAVGRYVVTLDHDLGIGSDRPHRDVVIAAGDTVRENFSIDTGIR